MNTAEPALRPEGRNRSRYTHRAAWDAHKEHAFACSAGESGPASTLDAVLCLVTPGGIDSLSGLEAYADSWVVAGGVLTAEFPAGERRERRTGAIMRATEVDGVLRIELAPRGKPVLSFSGGDGFIGSLADNEATYSGARYWWERAASLLGVVPVEPRLDRCDHLPARAGEASGPGLIAAVVAVSFALGCLLLLLS